MSFNLKNYKDKLLFIPLGGTNEIGINVNLYHINGKWIMVDLGCGFADEQLPGVDLVVADISFIEEHKEDLLGLIITHSHEDHLGAVQFLWESIGCPIYTTEYTKNFLAAKLEEYSFETKMKIHSVKTGDKVDIGPFNVEFVQLAHSAPEMQALMIRTSAGNIFHTGDWKFDNDPVIGTAADDELLANLGKEKVLALVCDSTNVFNKGHSGSEGDVRKNLVDIVAGCKGMVIIASFASNLARLDTLIHAGQAAGRKVVLTGRSLHRVLAAAQASGYLNDIQPLVDERNMGQYKRKDLLVIATGCQGEPMAATAKIAHDSHMSVKAAKGDTVIFSSRVIPGNEKKIFALFNKFVKKGVEVITEKDHHVHVSGHPSIEELKKMYQLIKPEICVPVHGEPVHIHEQAKLAKKEGIKKTLELENGKVALLDESNPEIIGEVENGYLAVDGNYLLPSDSSIFKMRKRMRDAGIVILTLVLDDKSRLLTSPILSLPGTLDPKEDFDVINEIRVELEKTYTKICKDNKGLVLPDQIETGMRNTLRRLLKKETGKSPIILVNIEEIE